MKVYPMFRNGRDVLECFIVMILTVVFAISVGIIIDCGTRDKNNQIDASTTSETCAEFINDHCVCEQREQEEER